MFKKVIESRILFFAIVITFLSMVFIIIAGYLSAHYGINIPYISDLFDFLKWFLPSAIGAQKAPEIAASYKSGTLQTGNPSSTGVGPPQEFQTPPVPGG